MAPTSQEPVPTAPSHPCPTPAPDLYTEASRSETANWKTYSNSYWKFQFKYPQIWAFLPGFKPTDKSFDLINFDYDANRPLSAEDYERNRQKYDSVKAPTPEEEFRIAIIVEDTYKSPEEYLDSYRKAAEQQSYSLEISNVKKIKVDSQTGLYYDLLTSGTGPLPTGNTVITSTHGYLVSFRFWRSPKNEINIPTYEQILSTFRFSVN